MSDASTPDGLREPHADQLTHIRQRRHPYCILCGSENPAGLHLNFAPLPDGSVQAEFDCGRLFEGYPNTLHGGIICLLLDGDDELPFCAGAHGTHRGTLRALSPPGRHGTHRVRPGANREFRPPIALPGRRASSRRRGNGNCDSEIRRTTFGRFPPGASAGSELLRMNPVERSWTASHG